MLLQNQGGLRVNLKGHVLVSDSAFEDGGIDGRSHAFRDDSMIPPGAYVILHSGFGEGRWGRTKDSAYVYHCYAERDEPIWESEEAVHLLAKQHTFTEPREVLVLR